MMLQHTIHDGILVSELKKSGIPQPQIIYVGNSINRAIGRIAQGTQAVIVSLLPQLDPEDYSVLLMTLKNRRMPAFSIGGNIFAQFGALAGLGPVDAINEFVARIGTNVKKIVDGEEAGEIPVDLTVSSGRFPDKFIVPDIINRNLKDAKKIIFQAGLTLGSISFELRDDLLPETVISQSVQPNLEVTQGDTINLIVSRLPLPIKDELE